MGLFDAAGSVDPNTGLLGSGMSPQMFGLALMANSAPSRMPHTFLSDIGKSGLEAQSAQGDQLRNALLGQQVQTGAINQQMLRQRYQMMQDALGGTGSFGAQAQPQASPPPGGAPGASGAPPSPDGGGGLLNSPAPQPTQGLLGQGQPQPAPAPAQQSNSSIPAATLRRAMIADAMIPGAGKAIIDADPMVVGPKAAAEAQAQAPYKMAESLLSQAGRGVTAAPGDNVFTGFSKFPPEMQQLLQRIMGGAQGGQPGQTAQRGMPPLAMGGSQQQGASGMDPNGFPVQSTNGAGGSLQTPLTLEGAEFQKKVLPEQYDTARKQYESAQASMPQMDLIDQHIEDLNKSGWSSTGAGANAKMTAIKGINGVVTSLGGTAPFDPQKVGSWEDFNKESTRMGMQLVTSMFGAQREAQTIVKGAISAVPNAENTYMGARLVSSSVRQAAQRNVDYYSFLQDFAGKHGGSTFGADLAFNKLHPAKEYSNNAIVNAVPPDARQMLLKSPNTASQFDEIFGAGTAKRVIGSGG